MNKTLLPGCSMLQKHVVDDAEEDCSSEIAYAKASAAEACDLLLQRLIRFHRFRHEHPGCDDVKLKTSKGK